MHDTDGTQDQREHTGLCLFLCPIFTTGSVCIGGVGKINEIDPKLYACMQLLFPEI
jgi:hypothetical protein